MKHAVFLAIVLALPAIAQETGDVQVSPETAARCKAEGGCVLISRKVMDALLLDSYKEGIADTAKYFEGMTCRKKETV